MKAWLLENTNDPDQGGWIVFADTRTGLVSRQIKTT